MRRSAILVLVGCTLAFAAAPAAARTKYETTTTFSYSPLLIAGFSGQVSSPSMACVGDRKVSVFRKRQGPDRKLGGDRTDSGGDWFVPYDKSVGESKYYARVKALDLGGGDKCQGYRPPPQQVLN